MILRNYIGTGHLKGTMYEFGRYFLRYEPPAGAVEGDISMSIRSDASLEEMVSFFESFLLAASYRFEGELAIRKPHNFWGESYESPRMADDIITFNT